MADNVVEIKVNASKVDLRLEEFPEDVRRQLFYEIELLGGALVDLARSRAETLLAVRTGKFLGHIRFDLKRNRNSLFGRVFSSDPRAGLFEWGGTTPAHDIAPKKAHALLLQMASGTRFAARVHRPIAHYKRLQIIHGAFDQMKPAIETGLTAVVDGAAARASE